MTIIKTAQSIVDKATLPKKRPTIKELEDILRQPDGPLVTINTDGSIGVGESDALTVARGILQLRTILLGDPGMPEAIRPLAYLQMIVTDAYNVGKHIESEDKEAYLEAVAEVQELHDKLKALVS